MSLLHTLVRPAAGSAARAPSILATPAYTQGRAPEPKVGEIVHLYGPQGVAYTRVRVFDVSRAGIRVVGRHLDERLSPAAWTKRVRPEPLGHMALLPDVFRPQEPPALPPAVAARQARVAQGKGLVVASLILGAPVALGAALGHLAGVGAARGAASGVGAIVGATTGAHLVDQPGAALGALFGGAAAGAIGARDMPRGAAVGVLTGVVAPWAAQLVARTALPTPVAPLTSAR